MRARPAAAVLAALLLTPLLGVAGASAVPRDLTGPGLPEPAATTASERAAAALDRAQALFAEKSPAAARRQAAERPDATLALREVVRYYDDLSAGDQREADRLLARPTDGAADPGGNGYTVAEAPPVCGDTVCVHHVDTTEDAATDAYVAQAHTLAEQINDTYVGAGYLRPDSDGTLGSNPATPTSNAGQVDIYLADLGSQGIYGYCTTDQPGSTYNRWAYCVIDNNYAEFPVNTPTENLQVTLAHEYFHAVQFAYDAFEDGWIMEATATWAEEQLFDAVDDNRQYLASGQLGNPYRPLDYYGEFAQYGNWVFFQYLSERWSARTGAMPTIVLDLWQRMSGRAGDPDAYSTQAVAQVLAARDSRFPQVYGQFAQAMRQPARSLQEGGDPAYSPAAPAAKKTLTPAKRSTPRWYAKPDHLTNLAARIQPSRKLRQADWRLQVRVDLPAAKTSPVARVVTQLKSGKVVSTAVKPRKRGWSKVVTPFSARKVRYVEVVLANASLRSDCWTGDLTYACQGDPRDDNVRVDVRGTAFRR